MGARGELGRWRSRRLPWPPVQNWDCPSACPGHAADGTASRQPPHARIRRRRLLVFLVFNSFPDYHDVDSWEGSLNKLGRCFCCGTLLQDTALDTRCGSVLCGDWTACHDARAWRTARMLARVFELNLIAGKLSESLQRERLSGDCKEPEHAVWWHRSRSHRSPVWRPAALGDPSRPPAEDYAGDAGPCRHALVVFWVGLHPDCLMHGSEYELYRHPCGEMHCRVRAGSSQASAFHSAGAGSRRRPPAACAAVVGVPVRAWQQR